MAAWVPDLSVRRREPELMDTLGLDPALHEQALDALARVNRVSLASARAWRELERLARDGRRPLRVLDVACGGGDVIVDLAARARRQDLPVELTGIDVSPVAIDRARRRARQRLGDERSAASVRFHEIDAFAGPVAGADLVLCTLFLHHLSQADAVRLLRSLAQASERVLLLQDLRRTSVGYALAWLGLHVLTRSPVARSDGLTSVRSAFTLAEVRRLASEAGLAHVELETCWPQRFTLRWERVDP